MDEKLENGILNIAKNLVAAATNLSLYTAGHSQVRKHLDKTLACISDLLKTRHEISFVIIEGDLVVDNYPLSADIFLSKFSEKLQMKAIGGVTFSAGLTRDELMNFIKTLVSGSDAESEISSSPHIKIGRVEIRIKGKARQKSGSIGAQEMSRFMEIYQNMEKNKKLDVFGIQSMISNIMSALAKESDPLRALTPMKSFNEYTFTHSVNVCILTILQAIHLGFEGQLVHDIGIAALLHDVGKLFIPDEILSKDGKLNEKEWEIVRQHPVKGASYLMDIPGIPGLSVIVAFEHHMEYNFSGYPGVGTGWKQNLCSQIAAISDVFDAMRTYRSYRDAFADEEIMALIVQKSGTGFNPFLVKSFAGIFKK